MHTHTNLMDSLFALHRLSYSAICVTAGLQPLTSKQKYNTDNN